MLSAGITFDGSIDGNRDGIVKVEEFEAAAEVSSHFISPGYPPAGFPPLALGQRRHGRRWHDLKII